jgi:glycosyltransferase involved in cell wall biosynthesis
LIGFTELGLNTQPIIDHFTKERADGAKLVAEAQSLIGVKSIITTPAQPKPERKIITDKISCVMTTFRRFSCVERSISMFLNQDYKGESELIVFNTDTEHLMELSEELKNKNVQVINCGIDSITKQPYTNVGAIRRDALEYASGEFYICWDDDDIFLPWNNRQCFEGLKRNNIKAFKPRQSFFARQNGIIELAQNTLEASVIVNIREVVFDLKTGAEHLQWYIKLRDEKQLNENSFDSVPAYCFNWGDPSELAGHKQSGSINDPNNFENHKVHTKDFAKRPLQRIDLTKTYAPYFKFFKEHVTEFNTVYYEKYVKPYLSEVV